MDLETSFGEVELNPILYKDINDHSCPCGEGRRKCRATYIKDICIMLSIIILFIMNGYILCKVNAGGVSSQDVANQKASNGNLSETQKSIFELLSQKDNQLKLVLCLKKINEGERERIKLSEEIKEIQSTVKALPSTSQDNSSAGGRPSHSMSITIQDMKNQITKMADKMESLTGSLNTAVYSTVSSNKSLTLNMSTLMQLVTTQNVQLVKIESSVKRLNSTVEAVNKKSDDTIMQVIRNHTVQVESVIHNLNSTIEEVKKKSVNVSNIIRFAKQNIDISAVERKTQTLQSSVLAIQTVLKDISGGKLLIHNISTVMQLMKNQSSRIAEVSRKTGSVVYTRWGRRTCSPGAELVYAGRVGGQFYSDAGGGSNYVCLHMAPTWSRYDDNVDTLGWISGATYQTRYMSRKDLFQHIAPCAVCRVSSRGSVMMVPGRNLCPSGWHQEYHGYLVSAASAHSSRDPWKRTEFVCVDQVAESATNGTATNNRHGAIFYNVQASCGSLPCGPYVQGRELTCAVCTK